MRILIVDDDDSIRDYLIIALENIIDSLDIIECTNAKEALKLLSADPYFQLIISDFNMPGGNGDELFKGLKERKFSIPFLLHTSLSPKDLPLIDELQENEPMFHYIQKGIPLSQFEEVIKNIPDLKKQKVEFEFKKIRIYFFLRFHKSLCDVYIRINEKKFVKFINKNEMFDSAQIKRIISKGVDYLYISQKDYEKFAVSVANQSFLQSDQTLSTEDKLKSTQIMLQHMAMTTGISKSVLSLAERNIELVIMEAQDLDKLSELLKQLRSREDYGHDHAYLLCYFCCVICDAMGWQTRRSREKLCFAALFHDIVLKDPDLAMIQSQNDQALSSFSLEDIQLYKDHPKLSAGLLDELAENYPQLDQIVLEHHEYPDGSGFPRGLKASQIQPLPSLFIICHALVHAMYLANFETEKYPEIFHQLRKDFNQGHFQKIMEKMQEIFLKKAMPISS